MLTTFVGSNNIAYKQYIHMLKLQLSTDHNTIMMVIEGVLRGLSRRKSLRIYNPVSLITSIGDESVLLIRDLKKVSGDYRYRHIPLPDEAIDLMQAMIEKRITMEYLPFKIENQYVPFNLLPSKEKRRLNRIINVEGIYNAGRTSFYNLLIKNRVGEVIRNSLMSHGATALQWNGDYALLPYQTHIKLTANILLPILRQTGLPELLTQLSDYVRKLPPVSNALKLDETVDFIDGDNDDASQLSGWNLIEPTYAYVPLTQAEEMMRRSLLLSLRRQNSCKPEMIIIAGIIELGIPYEHWKKIHSYLTFKSLVRDHPTNTSWFTLPLHDSDVGGMSLYACKLPDNSIFAKLFKEHYQSYCKRRIKSEKGETGAERLIERKLFDTQITPEMIVRRLRQLWRKNLRGFTLEPNILLKILNRFAHQQVLYQHNGPLFTQMFNICDVTLNYSSFKQQVEMYTGEPSQLADLNGTHWKTDHVYFDAVKKLLQFKAIFGLKTKATPGRIFQNKININNLETITAEEWFELFQKLDVPLNIRFIKDLYSMLLTNKYNRNKKLSSHKARFTKKVLPEIINQYTRRDLQYSKPFYVLPEADMLKVMTILATKVQTMRRVKSLPPDQKQLISTSYSLLYLFDAAFGCRSEESYQIKRVNTYFPKNDLYLYVPQGKSKNAARPILLSFFGWDSYVIAEVVAKCKVLQPVCGDLLFSRVHQRYKIYWRLNQKRKKAANDSFRKLLEKWFKPQYGITAHALRHSAFYWATRHLIINKYVNGNFWTSLCTLVDQAGHGTLDMLINEYIGTHISTFSGLFVFSTQSTGQKVENFIHQRDNIMYPHLIDSLRAAVKQNT